MERKRTQADVRKEEFDKRAAYARELGAGAIAAIDAVMAEEGIVLDELKRAVSEGMPEEEALDCFAAYHRGLHANDRPGPAAT